MRRRGYRDFAKQIITIDTHRAEERVKTAGRHVEQRPETKDQETKRPVTRELITDSGEDRARTPDKLF
jgi:hypothetical protein